MFCFFCSFNYIIGGGFSGIPTEWQLAGHPQWGFLGWMPSIYYRACVVLVQTVVCVYQTRCILFSGVDTRHPHPKFAIPPTLFCFGINE